MIVIEKRAESVEEAKQQGLLQLGMDETQVDVEVVSEGGDGELAVVRLSTKWSEEDGVLDFVCGLLDRMDLDCSLDIEPIESGYKVIINGEDSNYAIGHRGEVLDAIQYLAQISLNRDKESYLKVTVDAENYRDRRERILRDLANRLASKAVRERVNVIPGRNISYQKHKHRSETWTVVKGKGQLLINDQVRTIEEGESVVINKEDRYSIKAIDELHIIEVQIGDELIEEDIERFEWEWKN